MKNYLPAEFYEKEKEKYKSNLQLLSKKRSRLGWVRFVIFILTIAVSYKVFVMTGWPGGLVILTGIGILLYFVSRDSDNNDKIAHTKKLIQINEEELSILNEKFDHRYDGIEWMPPDHEYANDMDLFGKNSVFQMINRCETEKGRKRLAENLLFPLPVSTIKERHEAIKELANNIEWGQEFQALALRYPIKLISEQKALTWLQEEEQHFVHPAWRFVIPVYSLLSVLSLLATITGFIPLPVFSFLFILYITFSGLLLKKAANSYKNLTEIIKEITVLKLLVKWIEEKDFKSNLLLHLKNNTGNPNAKASFKINELELILERFDLLLNMILNILLNSFLLWGARQMIALNKWKKENKALMPKWFEMVAEFEVLNSLSVLKFNHQEWAMPAFSNSFFTLEGKSIGHPLISESKRVNSDFELKGLGQISLITGSNMAGKSTFLRSLGVNIILAQAGGPVCATRFVLSPLHLISSMRIADNLAENTSTFYAELKKLKKIIDAVNNHEPVFILLDEILRGTNSLDRHAGSEALISQLIKEKAVAVIATHDVELADLHETFPEGIKNYHFDVQVEGEELYFDYQLKDGVCTSMNASILMKKIGINR